VKVTAYRRQTVPDRGVVRSHGPLQNFLGFNHIMGTAEAKVVKFLYMSRLYQFNQQDDMSPTKGAWLWSRDCFKILQFVVMQRIT